jgi:hypothetical protein
LNQVQPIEQPVADFHFHDEGTIILLIPIADAAKDWTIEKLDPEPWQMFGGGIAIDHRMFGPIYEALTGEGFLLDRV